MIRTTAFFPIFYTCFFLMVSGQDSALFLTPADKYIGNVIDGISYESGNWKMDPLEEPFQSLGNHRAMIRIRSDAKAVRASIPWRRSDPEPNLRDVILINGKTGNTVQNRIVHYTDQEFAHIVFEPDPQAEIYYCYYYPYESTGGYYPEVKYMAPSETANRSWAEPYSGLSTKAFDQLPTARVTSIQSIDDFNSFFPMEIISSKEERNAFFKINREDVILFPEFREYPIRMKQEIPYHWINRGIKTGLQDTVRQGEYYTLQVGVYARNTDINGLNIIFSDLVNDGNAAINKKHIACINTDVVDLNGQYHKKLLHIEKGSVQALWIGIAIPDTIEPGSYNGTIFLTSDNWGGRMIHLRLDVLPYLIHDHGDNDPMYMSRLRWLNSTLGSETDYIIAPFQPIIIQDEHINILGRELILGQDGLPAEINSFFTEGVTSLKDQPDPILSRNIELNVRIAENEVKWHHHTLSINQLSSGQAEWQVLNESNDLQLIVKGHAEYDGMVQYKLDLVAKKDVEIQDIDLEIPVAEEAAKFILGLGLQGSKRPDHIDWQWNITRHQEGLWLGHVNKGLQYVLRDINYERPLNTNFYLSQPLNLPDSWYNDGKGGIEVRSKPGEVLCRNYSGPRTMKAGDTLHFNFRLLITPFKMIHWPEHFNTRFVHKYAPVDSISAWGGTVVNVHHANEINPYINYPYYNAELQKAYIDEAHEKGIKVKLYNTIRELSYKCHEIFPLRSLGDEIFNDGEGGGHPWLQEHLQDHYHKAWHAWRVNDAAILNKGTSRWTNYYIEGLHWLAKNQEIDGLYLDDIAFSRETVKRMIQVLSRQRDEVIIDLHSANQFNPRDGYINSALLYMEHFPYITRLWFGEYFEYDRGPDYWLTEVSGIPFGLTGEMLQDGGHPYRGMLYGMTTRLYGRYDPRPLWKLFDTFGIAESNMSGYWISHPAVRTGKEMVPATVYTKENEWLIVLASWSDKEENIQLEIDWSLCDDPNPDNWVLFSPGIESLQEYKELDPRQPIRVEKNQGLILWMKRKSQ